MPRAARKAALFICSVPRSLLREDRPFRRLPGELPEGLRQVLSVVEKEHPPRPLLHEESDQRRVGLGRITIAAGQDQIVRPIVRGLPAAGPDVVQGDYVGRGLGPAVAAHRAVLAQEPLAVRLHRPAGGTPKAGNGDCGMPA